MHGCYEEVSSCGCVYACVSLISGEQLIFISGTFHTLPFFILHKNLQQIFCKLPLDNFPHSEFWPTMAIITVYYISCEA